MGTHERRSGYRRRATAIATVAAMALGLSFGSSQTIASVPHKYSDIVGVGGSYAAGIEAGPHIAGMPEHCQQTAAAFPLEVAKGRGDLPVYDYACSGATTEDVRGISDSRRQPAQLRLAKRAMHGALVIVLVGGNDSGVRWMQYLEHCAEKGCADIPDAADDSPRYQQVTQDIKGIVETAYQGGARKVLVDGYPNPGKLGCLLELGLTHHRMVRRDYRRMDLALGLLNNAIEAGAENAGAQYVSLDPVFAGHGICAPKQVSDGPTGYASGPWISLSADGRWHPNSAGQYAIAQANLQYA